VAAGRSGQRPTSERHSPAQQPEQHTTALSCRHTRLGRAAHDARTNWHKSSKSRFTARQELELDSQLAQDDLRTCA